MQEETQLPLFGDPPSVPRRAADPILAEGVDASVTDGFTAPAATRAEQPTPRQDGAHADGAENARSLLALADISGIGFVTIRRLFDAYAGQLMQVWDAPEDELVGHLHATRIPQPAQVVRYLKDHAERLLRTGRERYYFLTRRRRTAIVFRGMEGYPTPLLDLPTPPAWLFVEGDPGLLLDPAIVAVVGTRQPSPEGMDAAKRVSVDLVRSGCVILSGLAEGIDEIGHRTAVDYGAPTIAVLGHGIDVVFPASTADLRRHLVDQGGAVVSEYLPGDSYQRERFVQRNRIQAALSHLVAVVEGKSKSGTAHTVRFARQLQRPLFGVRLGAPARTPQQELLAELVQSGQPVFDLTQPPGREQLRAFLNEHLPLNLPHPTGEPHLFRGLLQEIQRLAEDYDATDEDYGWLLNAIATLRSHEVKKHAR